jgi:hypothetical protein
VNPRRRWFRPGHDVTPKDVASVAPWRTVPVRDLKPFTIHLDGSAVRIKCAEVARYAGLDDTPPSLGWAEPGQLAGAVVIADTYTSALVPSWECSIDKLHSHRLGSLLFIGRDELELHAAKPGTVRLWLCLASQGRMAHPDRFGRVE